MLDDYEDRVITPAMPRCLARFCCVLNFVLPGTGTIVAGFAVFCCSKNEDMNFDDKCSSCCCSITVGILQMALALVLFIGWCWSIVWGQYYVEMSEKHYPDPASTREAVVTSQPQSSRVQSSIQHCRPAVVTVQPHSIPTPPPYIENPDEARLQSAINGIRAMRHNRETTGIGFTQSYYGRSTIGGSPIEVESPPMYETLYPENR